LSFLPFRGRSPPLIFLVFTLNTESARSLISQPAYWSNNFFFSVPPLKTDGRLRAGQAHSAFVPKNVPREFRRGFLFTPKAVLFTSLFSFWMCVLSPVPPSLFGWVRFYNSGSCPFFQGVADSLGRVGARRLGWYCPADKAQPTIFLSLSPTVFLILVFLFSP